jgi:hypothetical protein
MQGSPIVSNGRSTLLGLRQTMHAQEESAIATFEFKLVLDQVEIDEAEADAVYARCKDGTLITAEGVTYMELDHEAGSLNDSIRSAITDVNAAGFRVARVEIEADSITLQPAI